MKNLNAKGFSPAYVLLLIVIVGVIGGVGYYVYSSQNKTNESLDNAAKSQADPQMREKKEEPVKTTSQPKTTLTITEFGTAFSLSSGISDITYRYEAESSSNDNHALVYFSSDSLKASSDDCKNDFASLGHLQRYKLTDVYTTPTGETKPITEMNAIKLGDHYYLYETGQDACPRASQNSSDLLNKQIVALKTAINSLKLTQ